MRSDPRTILITFFSLLLVLAVGGLSEITAQGKGRGNGGDKRGGGQPQAQRQAPQQVQREQRQQPQMRQQAQRPQPQMRQQRPQMQRQMPQMRQMQRQQAQRPQIQHQQRQMPQWNRQAQRQAPQVQRQQRQMPQMNRQAQRWERPQQQRVDRGQQQRQRIDRSPQERQQNVDRGRFARSQQRVQRERPSIMRVPQRTDRGRNNAKLDNRSADIRQRGRQQADVQQQRGNGRASRLDDRQAQSMIQDRRGRGRQADDGVLSSSIDRRGSGRSNRDGNLTDGGAFTAQSGDFRAFRGRGNRQIDPSDVDISGFRDQYRAWRDQAQNEGWAFNENDFRTNVYEYRQREAWRDDLLRSVININIGYPNDYLYIAPPQYPDYYGINYEPWYYNIGYTYYDPFYSGFYVQPYYMAYRPYDYYYSSYFYDDPYYFDDPYDDYVTYRIFASSSSGIGGFVTRLLGGLLAYGYDQGYRDGLLARQAGYDYTEVYYDPYSYYYEEPSYQTVSTYQPYFYSSYEDRHCLSEGYSLGYEDAFYGENDDYDPYYGETNINIVSLYVGTTYQINV